MQDGEVLSARYRVICPVGRGGTGAVYQVEDSFLHKNWALKIYSGAGIPEEIFDRELQLLCRLDHPGLPRVVDIIRTREGKGIVMDLLEGKTLDRMKGPSGYGFSDIQVLNWGCQLCDILSYLHHQKPPVIYGDLKPANILLRPDDHIMLLDFGINRNLITPFYAAPEQFDSAGVLTPQTDLYGLGRTLGILRGDKDCTRETDFDVLLDRLTDPDPGKRGRSADDTGAFIRRIINEEAGVKRRGNEDSIFPGHDQENKRISVRIRPRGMILLLSVSLIFLSAVYMKKAAVSHEKQTPTATKGGAYAATSSDAASRKTDEKASGRQNGKALRKLKQEIASLISESPEKRHFSKVASLLERWEKLLEETGTEPERMTAEENWRLAEEERRCAEYYLTYEAELEKEEVIPGREAERLLLRAVKRLNYATRAHDHSVKRRSVEEKRTVFNLLLSLYQREGQAERALEVTDRLLRQSGSLSTDSAESSGYDDKELHLTRMNLLIDLDHHDEAYREFDFLFKTYPHDLKIYLSLISYDYKTGRLDEAVTIYRLAEKNGEVTANPDFRVMRTKLHNAGAM